MSFAPLGDLRRTLRVIGLATFLVETAHAVLALPNRPNRLTPDEVLPWSLCLLGFGIAFLTATHARAHRWILALLLAETVFALLANAIFDGNSVLAGLLLIVAAQLGLSAPLAFAFGWVALQTAVLLGIFLTYWPDSDAWAYGTGYLCFQIFAVGTGHLTVREAQARRALAQVNLELRETRALLGAASRDAERLHIARELHDLLGHHLAALNMNLEVARYVVTEPAAQLPLERSQTVVHLLLRDVRQVVGTLRQDPLQCDFREEVAQLCAGAPTITIRLSFADDFPVPGPVQAHILLRCVQEVMTNTVKHSGAGELWLEFLKTPQEVSLRAYDNGRGVRHLRPGCGLRGMRERLEGVGGRLQVEGRPDQGLLLLAAMPLTLPAVPTGGLS